MNKKLIAMLSALIVFGAGGLAYGSSFDKLQDRLKFALTQYQTSQSEANEKALIEAFNKYTENNTRAAGQLAGLESMEKTGKYPESFKYLRDELEYDSFKNFGLLGKNVKKIKLESSESGESQFPVNEKNVSMSDQKKDQQLDEKKTEQKQPKPVEKLKPKKTTQKKVNETPVEKLTPNQATKQEIVPAEKIVSKKDESVLKWEQSWGNKPAFVDVKFEKADDYTDEISTQVVSFFDDAKQDNQKAEFLLPRLKTMVALKDLGAVQKNALNRRIKQLENIINIK